VAQDSFICENLAGGRERGRRGEGEGRGETGEKKWEERGEESHRNMRTHHKVEREERDTPPETTVSVRAMVTL